MAAVSGHFYKEKNRYWLRLFQVGRLRNISGFHFGAKFFAEGHYPVILVRV